MEFVYNHNVNGATKFSPFKVVYGFNSRVPIDLMFIPIEERTSMDGVEMVEMMKELHKEVRSCIKEDMTKYDKHANKGRKMVGFEPRDLV